MYLDAFYCVTIQPSLRVKQVHVMNCSFSCPPNLRVLMVSLVPRERLVTLDPREMLVLLDHLDLSDLLVLR